MWFVKVYEKLETMVGVTNKLEGRYSWTLLKRIDEDEDDDDPHTGLYDLYKRTECHSKLAIAWRLMKECFEPIEDRHTKIDVIQSIVHNCGLVQHLV